MINTTHVNQNLHVHGMILIGDVKSSGVVTAEKHRWDTCVVSFYAGCLWLN